MELIVLGSGASFPAFGEQVRNPAGYAVKLGGDILLFDLGFGNLRQLFRAGLDPARITDLFLTHRHPDHAGDLAALLFLLRYDAKPRSGRLRIWGPRGVRKFVDGLSNAYAPWLGPRGYELDIRELAAGATAKGRQWGLSCLSVPHPTPALAYRLLYKGRSLVYSGDTGFSVELVSFAAEADLFVIECTVTGGAEALEYGHLTPELALATLEASGCRRGLLSHLSPASAKKAERLLRGRKIRLAQDLMRLVV
ncbi:MAG: MBL fold metallo-hydrolase [Elusimicrobia bacterium]|nr:MBL fold metallo-hydrolase [Elusimicrobiota bacterium]